MKQDEKNTPEQRQKNKFFTDIPKDNLMEVMPTMRAVIIANTEDPEEVEYLTRNHP